MSETNKWMVLMTDFGADNIGTAAMEGVAVAIDSELKLTNLTHSIEPFNVWQASDSLLYAEPFWPCGTVFVSVIDPGVGTKRRASVAKLKDGKFVVTPDNGTLTHLAEFVGIEEIREIDETINRLPSTTKTSVFHGRDLFAYCGAKLASGLISFEEVGPAYPVEEVIRIQDKLYGKLDGTTVKGLVTSTSRTFGNVFTNIQIEKMEEWGFEKDKKYHLVLKSEDEVIYDDEIDYVTSFGYVEKGAPLMFNGSTLCICIACNQASFMDQYNMDSHKKWTVEISR